MSKKKERTPARAGDSHAAMLRGINVGGKNSLAMRDLADVFTAAGCGDVRTYIQSGNVVFRAAPRIVTRLATAVTQSIEQRHGLRVPVVLRTARELEQVGAKNPFLAAGVDPNELHVLFLADRPKAGAAAGLDARRSPPDEFALVGREVYLRLPNGAARTKLTNAYFDTQLATTSTMRNWRTVLKLIELASE